MVYVDLNPIRAKLANTPESSRHTSIRYRIQAANAGKTPRYLLPFTGDDVLPHAHGLPFELSDYLELVDDTGRHFVKNKAGSIDPQLPKILTRLALKPTQWHELTTTFEACFGQAVGNEEEMLRYQRQQQLSRLRHRHTARRLFG